MKHCLFSISYAGLWGQHCLALTEFISKAAALGYDGVMIAGKRPHLSPLDSTPERIGEIKAHLEKEGIACEVIAGYTDFSGAMAAEVPVLEMQIAYVEALAKIGAELGAGFVRVFTAYEAEGHPVGVVWNRVVSSLRECCDRAAEYGVTIAISEPPRYRRAQRFAAGTVERYQPTQLQVGVRRVVSGPAGGGSVQDGQGRWPRTRRLPRAPTTYGCLDSIISRI